MGFFFTDQDQNNGEYVLNKETWNKIGNKMHLVRKNIPSSLGRPLRNIVLHYRGYKAEEWSTWITMYSLPFLKNQLPNKYYKGWGLFVKAVRLCQKRIITYDDLNKIRSYLLAFYRHYKKEYYHGLLEHLNIMKIYIYNILHVLESIFQTKPCCATWQYPIERMCRMLLSLTKSKLHLYKNLINNVHLHEIFNCLKFN